MNKDNIDDISLIEKENQNFSKDESTMSLYNNLLTMSTPIKAPPLQRTPSIKETKPKRLCFFNQTHKKENAKATKYLNSPPSTVINKQSRLIVQHSNIDIKPISEFLSNRDCIHWSYPQSDYMAELDSLYSLKIKTINEIDAKYDSELFSLREYLDGTDGNNINNIIYNSVLKDKIEELKVTESKFSSQKAKALQLYNQRGAKMRNVFAAEIQSTFSDIKNEVVNQMTQLTNH